MKKLIMTIKQSIVDKIEDLVKNNIANKNSSEFRLNDDC